VVLAGSALLGPVAGCKQPAPEAVGTERQLTQPATDSGAERAVAVTRPARQAVRHPIEQPGFNIEAFQETPLFPRITGYVGTWDPALDIGKEVRKGQVLAELHVPERVVEVRQKEAALRQAGAQVLQARAAVLTAEAQLTRAKSQYERLARAGRGGVLDKEQVEETRLGYKAAEAGLEKARADVTAAEAQEEVAKANRDYAKTMLAYAQVRAPFAGVITARNVNVGDFVQPAGLGAKGRPLFVVSQMDPVRVFVNIPGADAAWIKDGDPVTLRLQGAGGGVIEGKVTRNARSLDPRARTLRTEIDLPNPEGKLLPGMYVQATILVEHRGVWTLPASAVVMEGDHVLCYRLVGGKAVRTPLQVGLRGDGLVQVLKKQVAASAGEEGRWEDISGEELVVAADPEALHDGQPVRPLTAEE
jgi:RND family efflux transporter MFP subunit